MNDGADDAAQDRDDAPDDAKEGTFLVTAADDETATVRDVHDQQVLALSSNPGIEAGDVLEATVAPDPPLDVSYSVVEVEDRRTIPVEHSSESPTKQARDLAEGQSPGDLTRRERAGEGELHVLTVPEEETTAAAEEVVDDEATLERAARMGVDRVSVRAADGVVSVRYLPD